MQKHSAKDIQGNHYSLLILITTSFNHPQRYLYYLGNKDKN